MATKLYVGNLPYSADDESLRAHFAGFGTVESASVVIDRESGQSRGFGFVEVAEGEADDIIGKADGADMDGRPLKVNVARPREER